MREILIFIINMAKHFFFILLFFSLSFYAQTNPSYGNEKAVTINGLSFDAMEPHLSADGNALFFNSLNNGINTSLYYAGKVNDSTFNFIGLVPIVNQTVTPRLDGVASLDSANNFYWVSTRNLPNENLHRIRFLTSSYTNYGLVYGDFYSFGPGKLIMDAAVNYQGDKLIYCNAYFNNCFGGAPCEASMGIAEKLNDSTFNKMPTSDAWFLNINDTVNYIVYAPFLTQDGLELFFTRLLKNGSQTEIMVATRPDVNSAFGAPSLLIGSPEVLPEAAALTNDKSKMYYHKKVGATFKIFYRGRITNVGLGQINDKNRIVVFPNPSSDYINVMGAKQTLKAILYDCSGKMIVQKEIMGDTQIDLSNFENGAYTLCLRNADKIEYVKICILK